jgi:hypothetical protein
METTKRDIIKFEDGVAIPIILESEPSTAKGYTKETKFGTKTSYAIFVDKNRMLFASEVLHSKLSEFHKGDAITITLSDKRWVIQGSSTTTTSPLKQHLEGEQIGLLTKIAEDIKEIKETLYGKTKEDKKEYPKEISEIDF